MIYELCFYFSFNYQKVLDDVKENKKEIMETFAWLFYVFAVYICSHFSCVKCFGNYVTKTNIILILVPL